MIRVRYKMDETAIDSEDFPLMKANNKGSQDVSQDNKYAPENAAEHGCRNCCHSYEPKMDFRYQDIWYDLGAPIAFPFLKFVFSIVLWILENFFLIMNTLNAIWIREGNSPELKRERILIASLTIGFHVGSCIIISFIDSLNKVTISGNTWSDSKRFAIFRLLAHATLTMKILRYFSAYVENRKKNKKIQEIRKKRLLLSEEEIQFVVDIKKNDLVDCHYDVIEIFFKNVPAALLQVFLMFQTSPAVRLKLTTRLDIYRFLTVFFTIISGAALTTNYQLSYNNYKKVLHFQDCFRTNFKHAMNLNLFGGADIIVLFCNQLTSIGVRICFFSLIIFWNPNAFLIVFPFLLLGEWIFGYIWCRTSWRFRPILENPLYGLPCLSFELIDSWINLYSPGVHYLKFIHHFISNCVLNAIALCIFQGFATITTPIGTGNTTLLLDRKVPNYTEESKSSLFEIYTHLNNMFNCTTVVGPNDEAQTFAEDEYFIGSAIKVMLHLHEYITLNEIPYVYFFFYVIKLMNIVAIVNFVHICCLNFYNKFDLDFPIQIVHDFYVPVLKNFQFNSSSITKKFLLVNLLSNSDFFSLFYTWDSVKLSKLDEGSRYKNLLQKTLMSPENRIVLQNDSESQNILHCISRTKWMQTKLVLLQLFSPESLREATLNYKVDICKESILKSVEHHILCGYLQENLINYVYDDADEETKLLLAVFCENFDVLMKHTTSFRLQKTFSLLGIRVEKGCAMGEDRWKRDEVDGLCKRHIWDIIVKDFVEI